MSSAIWNNAYDVRYNGSAVNSVWCNNELIWPPSLTVSSWTASGLLRTSRNPSQVTAVDFQPLIVSGNGVATAAGNFRSATGFPMLNKTIQYSDGSGKCRELSGTAKNIYVTVSAYASARNFLSTDVKPWPFSARVGDTTYSASIVFLSTSTALQSGIIPNIGPFPYYRSDLPSNSARPMLEFYMEKGDGLSDQSYAVVQMGYQISGQRYVR